MMTKLNAKWLCGTLAFMAIATLAACNNGGTGLPPGVNAPGTGGQANGQAEGQLAPLNLQVAGFVGGEAPGVNVAEAKSGTSKTNSPSGTLSGANGLDLKDAAWNNLFSSGLTTSTLPQSSAPKIRFLASGSTTAMNETAVGGSGLFNTSFDARALRTGTNLILEMEVNGNATQIMLPVLTVDDGDRVGFNAIRRFDGSLIVELFIDAVNNDSGASIPDGRSDNGLRVMVDNGFDIDGDDLPDTVARMDSLDGQSLFDLNLDGRFGDPSADGLTYLDTDSDGYAETPIHLATQEQRDLSNGPQAIALLIDPELDGFREENAERILGDGSPADFVAETVIKLSPDRLPANGLNTATAGVSLRPTRTGLPIGTSISFSLARHGGTVIANATNGEARFVDNNAAQNVRLIDPSNPAVRVFFNGKTILTETLIAPALIPSSVNAETELTLTTTILGTPLPAMTNTLGLDPSMAPIVSNVAFNGQNDFSQVMGGLDATSTAARLVWGDRIEITGQNFATVASANIVSIGGIETSGATLSGEGTRLTVDIPDGATTGPVSVVVGGVGGRSSENLVIAGQPFVVESISPSGSTLPANSTFAIRMSRQVNVASLAGSVSVVDASDVDLGWSASLGGDGQTIELSVGSGTAMSDGSSYRVLFTSDLAADDATPTLHFDPIANTQVGAMPEVKEIASFTAMAPDNTQPTLITNVPMNLDSGVDIRTTLIFTFSEAMSVASIVRAVDTGSMNLLNNDTSTEAGYNWNLSEDLRTLSIFPVAPLAGNSNYVMTLPATINPLTDVAGNLLDPIVTGSVIDHEIAFNTGLGVEDISPRSGPAGTTVTVTGGDFSLDQNLSVTIGGQAATHSLLDANTLEVTVPAGPEGFTGGALQVSVSGESALAPSDFTVTLMLATVDLEGAAGSAPIGLALSRDNKHFFVSNQGNGSIASYNLDSLKRVDVDGFAGNGVDNLKVGRVPTEALLSRDGRYLLALDFGTQASPGDSFFVISVDDHATGKLDLSNTIGVDERPTRIATSPDGSRWYVTNNTSNTVSVISAEEPFQVLSQIPTGDGPNGIAISPDGSKGFVCNFTAGTVTVFDTASNEKLNDIPVGAGPARAKITPNGKFVMVTCNGSESVHFIEIATNTNVANSSVAPEPSAMEFSRDGNDVYIASRRNDVVGRYSMNIENGIPSLTQNAFIKTARTPSGIAVTNDGSRLIVTCEGAGFPQVIFLEQPAQTVERITRTNLVETTIADRGEVVVLHGENFDPIATNNMVSFNGALGDVIQNQSTETQLGVRIPEGATTGPLVVRIGTIESSPVAFVISPRIPRTVRSSPAANTTGVRPDAQITVTFNEPIIATTNDVLLFRMLDTFTNGTRDVDLTSIPGALTFRDFGRELVFTPTNPMVESPNSENIYAFRVLRSVMDQAGNRLESAVQFSFRLTDSLGPILLAATYIDVDNNGVDVGDVVNFVFDEPVVSQGLPHVIGTNGSGVGFSDASTLGVGATFERPSLALLERTSPPNELDDLNRTIMVRLGQSPSLIVPGMRTAVTSLSNFALSGLQDAAGNLDLALASASIDVGIALASAGNPEVLSAVLLNDGNTNNVADAGEVIALYTNQPLTLLAPIVAGDFTLMGAGASFGANPTIALDPTNARVLRITLGVGGSFDFADAMSGSPTFSISAPAGLPNAVSFLDIPLQPWSSIVYSVGESTTGPRIETSGTPIIFRDIDNNGVDAGDIVEVRMDAEVTVGSAPAALCFSHPVVGNDFGSNAFIRGSQNVALTQQERARTVEIVLGANAKLLPAGTYQVGQHNFGLPSGIDVLSTIPLWAVADVFGNSAQPNLAGGSDLGSSDMTAPSMVASVYRDENSNGTIDAGDAIIIVFDEPLKRNGAVATDFIVEIQSSSAFNLGSGASLTRGPNKPVNGMFVQNNSLRLTLGEGTNIVADSGVDLVINSGNPIADESGNNVLSFTRVPLDLNLPETPTPLLALIHDSNSNGQADAGDLIWVKFDQSVSLGSSSPEGAFTLINPSASFGSGAFMGTAQVDAALIATGMTARANGTSDPQIITITLGSNPILPDLAGTAPKFAFNYGLGQAASLYTSATPVGIALHATSGVSFSGADLTSTFSDASQTGSDTVFEGISLSIGLFNGAPAMDALTLSFSLPGEAQAFLPISSHFARLVSAMNTLFKNNSRSYRAFYNAAFSEIVIVSNQQGTDITSILINQGDSFSGVAQAFSTTNFSPIRASGSIGFEARGSVDIGGMLSSGGGSTGPAPELSGALFNGSEIELFFDVSVTGNSSYDVEEVFTLPVVGDNFGVGASYAFLNGGVTITLGSNPTITDAGLYNDISIAMGSPSGITMNPAAPTDSVISLGGTLASPGIVDIEGQSVSAPAQMVSAFYDPIEETIVVTFDQDVQYEPTGDLPADSFALAVSGDSFGTGTGAPRLVTSISPNKVTILVGMSPFITTEGIFSDVLLGAGMPSGLSTVAPINPLMPVISGLNGEPVLVSTIDIDGPEPPQGVDLAFHNTNISQFKIGVGDPLPMMGIDVSTESDDDFEIVSMLFSLTGTTPFDIADIANSWLLFVDSNQSGGFELQSDTAVGEGIRVGSSLQVQSGAIPVFTDSSGFRLFLVMERATAPSLVGQSFQISLDSVQADNLSQVEISPVEGLPIIGNSQMYTANNELPATNFVGEVSEVGFTVETGTGLYDRASVSTNGNSIEPFPFSSTISASEIQSATIADLDGALISVRLTSFDSHQPVNLPSGTAITSASAKAHALMVIVNDEIEFQGYSDSFQVLVDRNGSLVLRSFDPSVLLDFEGLGGFSSPVSGGKAQRPDGDFWTNDTSYAVFFGGNDGSGAVGTLDVYAEDPDGSGVVKLDLDIIPDPIEGSPMPRYNAAMTIDENGIVYMHGGRNNSTTFGDLWSLTPVFAPSDHGFSDYGVHEQQITGLRWTQINTGSAGTSFHNHTMSYVAGSQGSRRASLVILGGVNSGGNVVSNIASWDFEFSQWLSFTAVAGSVGARNGHICEYQPSNDALIVVGGASDAAGNNQFTNVSIVSFVSEGTYLLSTFIPAGNAPLGKFESAGVFLAEDDELLMVSGIDKQGGITSELSILHFDSDYTAASWQSAQSRLSDGIDLERAHGNLVLLDDIALLAYGMGPGPNIKSTLVPIEFSSFGGTNEDDLGVAALYLTPSNGGTQEIDAGETLTIRFGFETNLHDLYPSGFLTLSEIESHMAPGGGESGNFPAGTTAEISNANFYGDVLTITFGGSATATVFDTISFMDNGEGQNPIRIDDEAIGGEYQALGSADHSVFHEFIGISGNYWDAANWSQGVVPGTGEVAYIPSGKHVVAHDGFSPSQPSPVLLSQLLVIDATFQTSRDFELVAPSADLNAAGIAVVGGAIKLQDVEWHSRGDVALFYAAGSFSVNDLEGVLISGNYSDITLSGSLVIEGTMNLPDFGSEHSGIYKSDYNNASLSLPAGVNHVGDVVANELRFSGVGVKSLTASYITVDSLLALGSGTLTLDAPDEAIINRGVYLGATTPLALAANTDLIFGPGATEIYVPDLNLSSYSFDGIDLMLSDGFEFGLNGTQLSGSISLDSLGNGYQGSTNSLLSTGFEDEIDLIGVEIPENIENAALSFMIRSTDGTTSVTYKVRDFFSSSIIEEQTIYSGSGGSDSLLPHVWKHVTLPFEVPESQMVDISISIENFGDDSFIDDIEVISHYRVRSTNSNGELIATTSNNFSINSALVDFSSQPTSFTTGVDLSSSLGLTAATSRLLFEGGSTLNLGGSTQIPAGLSIALTNKTNATASVSWSNASAKVLNGILDVHGASFTSGFSNNTVVVSQGGSISLSDCEFTNGQLNILDSDPNGGGLSAAGLYLNSVSFDGVGGANINGGTPSEAYVLLQETGSQVEYYAVLQGVSASSPSTSIFSSVDTSLSEPFYVTGYGGPFFPAMEDDPQSDSGTEDESGNIQWDATHYASIELLEADGTPFDESTRVYSPNTNEVFIVGWELTPLSEEFNLQGFDVGLYSNVDDEFQTTFSEIRAIVDNGDGIFTSADMVSDFDGTFGSIDDPSNFMTGSPLDLLVPTKVWFVGDIHPTAQLGTIAGLEIDLLSDQGIFPKSRYPSFPPFLEFRIGDNDEPTVTDYWVSQQGNNVLFDPSETLVITGANLDKASNVVVEYFDSSMTETALGTATVSPDGRFITGFNFLGPLPSSSFFQVRVTLDTASGTKSFVLAAEIEAGGP